jgi:cell division protein FtsX
MIDIDIRDDDGRDLFAAVDQLPVPDLWPEIRDRAPVADRRRGPVAAVVLLVAAIATARGLSLLTDDGARDVAIGQAGDAADGADITVIVWMEPDATADQLEAVATGLEADDRVETVTYVDQEASFDEFVELFAERPEVVETVEPEDIPSKYRVELYDVEITEPFVAEYTAQPGVQDVTTPALGMTIRMAADTTGDELDRTAQRLRADERVDEVVFVGREDTAADLERRFAERGETVPTATEGEGGPPSFRVTLHRPVDPQQLASDYAPLPGVDDVVTRAGDAADADTTLDTGPKHFSFSRMNNYNQTSVSE